ncbi:PQQ-binding-like beta-propeller repeat protein [Streptomyces sp. WMMC500]|uniref:outer membrane protein assembly factor BamB family protein n=1 Tax=Streptomyces sp. WMMC500 TaxID=3015154 RepID=UPI00248C7273|nr:PQQ-binding-like beta-propeller repeat protein [Streptomyces sp. WMMC500]WBB64263.1 PQQ-binding-like beta-propeller repeat protein [Streptomyces sp. WMMC500]
MLGTAAVMLAAAGCGDDGGEGGDAADGGAELAERWRTESVDHRPEDVWLPPMWVAGDVVVSITTSGVTGHDAATGKAAWELPAPEGAGAPCAASPTVNGKGVGAVLFAPAGAQGGGDACSVLGVVDTASGDLLWSKDLTAGEDSYPTADVMPVSIGEESVTVELLEDGLHRFSIDGGELPTPEVTVGQECDDFYVDWRHSAEHLVAVVDCPDLTGAENYIAAYDSGSGEELWNAPDFTDEDQPARVEILADEPLTVATQEKLVSFDEDGKPLADLPLDRPDGYLHLDPGDFTIQESVLVTSYDDATNDYVGIDLATGKELWKQEFDSPPHPLAAGNGPDGELVGLQDRVIEEENALSEHLALWNARKGGEPATKGVLPEDTGSPQAVATSPDDGTLYVLAEPEVGGEALRIEAYER